MAAASAAPSTQVTRANRPLKGFFRSFTYEPRCKDCTSWHGRTTLTEDTFRSPSVPSPVSHLHALYSQSASLSRNFNVLFLLNSNQIWKSIEIIPNATLQTDRNAIKPPRAYCQIISMMHITCTASILPVPWNLLLMLSNIWGGFTSFTTKAVT